MPKGNTLSQAHPVAPQARYPITGCGLPGCRTCHPDLIPERPRWRLRAARIGVDAGWLAFAAVLGFLVVFAMLGPGS